MNFTYTLINRGGDYLLTINGQEHICATHDDACHIIHRTATARIYQLLDDYYGIVLKHTHATNLEQWRALSEKYKGYVANQYPFYMVKDQMTVERLQRLLPPLPTPRTQAQSILNHIDQLYTYMQEKTDHHQTLDTNPQSIAA